MWRMGQVLVFVCVWGRVFMEYSQGLFGEDVVFYAGICGIGGLSFFLCRYGFWNQSRFQQRFIYVDRLSVSIKVVVFYGDIVCLEYFQELLGVVGAGIAGQVVQGYYQRVGGIGEVSYSRRQEGILFRSVYVWRGQGTCSVFCCWDLL